MRKLLVIGAIVTACGDDGAAVMPDAPAMIDSPAMVEGWTTGADVGRGAIQETAAVAVAGKIYLIGGFDKDEGIVGAVQTYDTATNTWGLAPPLPRTLHHANAVTDGTTIYVLGALSGNNFVAIGDTYIFTPGVDIGWRSGAAMPTGRERGAAVAAVIGGKIYLAGGFRNVMASDMADVYDPGMNSWSTLANMPATRDHSCGGALSGQLVVAGGRTVSTSSPRADVWSYDTVGNMWTARTAMPTARGGMGCGVIDDVLYTAGGEGNPAVASGVFANVEAYSLTTNTWTELAAMPNPKHGVGGAVWNRALYLCGGADVEAFGAIAGTDVFRP